MSSFDTSPTFDDISLAVNGAIYIYIYSSPCGYVQASASDNPVFIAGVLDEALPRKGRLYAFARTEKPQSILDDMATRLGKLRANGDWYKSSPNKIFKTVQKACASLNVSLDWLEYADIDLASARVMAIVESPIIPQEDLAMGAEALWAVFDGELCTANQLKAIKRIAPDMMRAAAQILNTTSENLINCADQVTATIITEAFFKAR